MGVLPINKLLVNISVPIMLSMLVQALYNVVDSFDTHAKIPEHFAAVDSAAKAGGKVGIISCGWESGDVFLKPPVCQSYPSRRAGLYLSGAAV